MFLNACKYICDISGTFCIHRVFMCYVEKSPKKSHTYSPLLAAYSLCSIYNECPIQPTVNDSVLKEANRLELMDAYNLRRSVMISLARTNKSSQRLD